MLKHRWALVTAVLSVATIGLVGCGEEEVQDVNGIGAETLEERGDALEETVEEQNEAIEEVAE